jgi:hypothetical protein
MPGAGAGAGVGVGVGRAWLYRVVAAGVPIEPGARRDLRLTEIGDWVGVCTGGEEHAAADLSLTGQSAARQLAGSERSALPQPGSSGPRYGARVCLCPWVPAEPRQRPARLRPGHTADIPPGWQPGR